MKKFELIQAGLPAEVEILSEDAMSYILGGDVKEISCGKGYNGERQRCKCGYHIVYEAEPLLQ